MYVTIRTINVPFLIPSSKKTICAQFADGLLRLLLLSNIFISSKLVAKSVLRYGILSISTPPAQYANPGGFLFVIYLLRKFINRESEMLICHKCKEIMFEWEAKRIEQLPYRQIHVYYHTGCFAQVQMERSELRMKLNPIGLEVKI